MGLPGDLAEIDAFLDDVRFFEPFRPFFDPVVGRPSIPMETYLRMMFLKYRYRLGFEPLCREVADSLAWRRFCRVPLGSTVPHPTTLMKITSRCGEAAVDGLNEALLAKAHGDKLIRLDRVRADTTVVAANVAYPTDSGLLAKGVAKLARLAKGRLGRPVEFGYKAQVVDNRDGVVLDHTVEKGNPPDAPGLVPAVARITARFGKAPRAVAADRGYGEAAVDAGLESLGVKRVVIPRKGRPGAARQTVE